MFLRWHEILKLCGLYSVVALIFATWGLVCGGLVYLEGWNQTALLTLAVVGGSATAFPIWNFLSRARAEAEQTIWLSFPATARLVPIAATVLFTVWATSSPAEPSTLAPQSLTTIAQNVLALDAIH